jgi:hypothetical protein
MIEVIPCSRVVSCPVIGVEGSTKPLKRGVITEDDDDRERRGKLLCGDGGLSIASSSMDSL